MKTLLCFLRHGLMGLMSIWLGLGSISFAAAPDNKMIHFGIYSITPIPVRLIGSARLPEGEVILPTIPSYIKQVILSPKTNNPFRVAYSHLYAPAFIKQLQGCPFLGMPYDLDGNTNTQEWIVMTVFYGCVREYNSLVSSQPHNWILQQDAKKQFRVLMESDGTLLSATKTQARQKNYDRLVTNHYVVNLSRNARPQCGMAHIKWQYRQNRYQIIEQQILSDDCDSLFEFGGNSGMLPEVTRNNNLKKAQKAVEAVVAPWLKQLRAIR